jgi:hypothetical protein
MRALVVALAVIAVAAARADAHGLRTAYVEITELAPGRALVRLRLGAPDPALAIAADCTLTATGDASSPIERAWLLDCERGFPGRALAVTGLGPITSEAVAHVARADGTTSTQLVRVDAAAISLDGTAPSGLAVAREFVGLGLRHIATGYDHLLFLLLLVLLIGDWRGVLLAETAFTISHSIAFSATVLGVVRVAPNAAEICIALSLVLVAADVDVRGAARGVRWRGAAMALVFGFVHGLGFAGGLREIGLPEHAIGAALVGFGAGIELGQVAFLAIVLATLYAVRSVRALPTIKLGAVYAIGGFAAFLAIARAIG